MSSWSIHNLKSLWSKAKKFIQIFCSTPNKPFRNFFHIQLFLIFFFFYVHHVQGSFFNSIFFFVSWLTHVSQFRIHKAIQPPACPYWWGWRGCLQQSREPIVRWMAAIRWLTKQFPLLSVPNSCFVLCSTQWTKCSCQIIANNSGDDYDTRKYWQIQCLSSQANIMANEWRAQQLLSSITLPLCLQFMSGEVNLIFIYSARRVCELV